MKRIVVVLKMADLNATGKIDKARTIVAKMTGNSNFSSPVPALSEVSAAVEAATKAYTDSRDAGKQQTLHMMDAVERMHALCRGLATYVENLPGITEEIVISAGMDVRRAPNRFNYLLKAVNGENPGEVKLNRKSEGGGVAYLWQYAEETEEDLNWIDSGITTVSNTTINGLKSENAYMFRVATVEDSHQQPWSDGVRFMVG